MIVLCYGGVPAGNSENSGTTYQLPKAGEWTRIELTQEFDEDVGRYTLSLSIGDNEVIKVDHEGNKIIGYFDIPDTADVKPLDSWICIGEEDIQIPGFVRRLVVLEKP